MKPKVKVRCWQIVDWGRGWGVPLEFLGWVNFPDGTARIIRIGWLRV